VSEIRFLAKNREKRQTLLAKGLGVLLPNLKYVERSGYDWICRGLVGPFSCMALGTPSLYFGLFRAQFGALF
jgi:hypothetical protein